MKKIAQGAEAIISIGKHHPASPVVVQKVRFEKKYRIPELDKPLRQFRTRRESKILQKLEEIHFPSPRLIESNDKTMTITMSKVEGIKLRDFLKKNKYTPKIGVEIGKTIALLHTQNIIHQDLTTSNMIKGDTTKHQPLIAFIDFGLSFFSDRDEDKAVDLFLCERAIGSTHYELYPKMWNDIIKGYTTSEHTASVLTRLKQVQDRGRNKKK